MISISEKIKNSILVLDGATGTALQDLDLGPEDFGGEKYNGCNENLVLTRPDVIRTVHERYLEAGADIVETNTFGSTPLVLAEFDLGHMHREINLAAASLAREACDAFSTAEKPRYVAGAMGPTTKALSVTGGITFDELVENFYQQASALIEGKVDYLLLETALDTLNIKAGYCGILKAFETTGKTLPIALSGTIETMGTMLAGQGVEALYASVEHMKPLYIGLNCATGPEFMRDHIRSLSEISRFPVSVVPNAGIPDADGLYPEGAEKMSATLSDFVNQGWVNVIGGCCGTTYEHIRRLAELVDGKPPRIPAELSPSRVSGIEPLTLEEDGRPYIIGERTNVIGSRAFKRLIEDEKFDESAEIARKQVKAGAHIIDICLSNTERDEESDMKSFLSKVLKMTKAPIMIDSQVPEVVETAFKMTQGKCMLNSINLEDGEKSFEDLLPLVKRYGASVVVGCIRGEMAVTAEEKLDVAIESYELLTKKYGIREEDIVFDPLVFPCGTGDENYFGSGKETIEGVRLIKEKYPNVKTTLGISNVSFGLPPAGREVLNSVFLYHCTKAGLDTAIVNAEKLVRFAQIPEEEKQLCDDLLWYRTEKGDPVARFAAHFRDRKVQEVVQVDRSKLSIDEKIEINIVQGTKEFLLENLDEALKTWDALGVINNPLMKAMAIVGRMFNENELIVAEVLQSAEVMKASVSYLEQFMKKNESNVRGTIILATVKGDVHDIGKNLVEIILSNNGFKVIDLGIKCPPETLIEACRDHSPDLIGLSGLLVKSAQQMIVTAADLKSAGISVPLLVGGAALTESFTDLKISKEYDGATIYCKDAMSGLDVCNKLVDKEKADPFIADVRSRQKTLGEKSAKTTATPRKIKEKKQFEYASMTAKATQFSPVIVEERFERIWPYINEQMLYGNHLGLKGKISKLREDGDEKFLKLDKKLQRLKKEIVSEGWIKGKAIYQFFKVKAEENKLIVLSEDEKNVLQVFEFPRQSGGHQLCLTDFVKPGVVDEVCFFVLTTGDTVAEKAKELLNKGDYVDSHILSAIALEAAEGFAELLHQKLRAEWGIPDAEGTTLQDIFKLKYKGVRVSFGYPACPRLEDQEKLWKLLKPSEAIGVTLSEEFMMYPEASVSALVFHLPDAHYFSISNEDVFSFEEALSQKV